MKKTAVQQIIEKFEYIKENHCKSLQEVVFFDGILAVLESGKYKEMEKEQIMNAWMHGFEENQPYIDSSEDYYNETFKPE